ncbi:putative GNAT family acetyltransferase [Leucobacter exalbidus]|uniref:GNAT family acetyltransferase n=1 Tax=Leucobacter exalbidus TaxID=662960 RepID=A0A940PV65_9MICO|nr:GNAT family N-acetyltransferase [Leucobacter exalbidus]MBP1324791.1 putative GNAT family acetyltransferase [Leucobacter exalbidus]
MARYLDEAQAAAAGFTIAHEPEAHRFTVTHATAAGPELVGEAHYSLLGETVIDFDHTLVTPTLRGTGLSGLLAQHALSSELAQSRRIAASCWFIEGYLKKHPELRSASTPTDQG